MNIYFVTLHFDQQVHAQAAGFTDHFYQHVQADGAPRAESIAKQHFETAYPIKVVKTDAQWRFSKTPNDTFRSSVS
jgi:hypothetical protein